MIDWDRVADLRAEIGAEDFSEVVEIFLEEVEEEIIKLSPQASLQSLQSTFHFLKGSALNLGFRRFSDLCQSGESAAQTGDCVDLEAVKSCYENSKTEFLAALHELDAA